MVLPTYDPSKEESLVDEGYLSSEDTWRGRFWLPGRPDDVQRGILTYTPNNGVRLTMIGGFDDAVWMPTGNGNTQVLSARSRRWPVIHGVVGNKPVTLIDCAAVRSTSYWIGTEIAEQEIRASKALLGVLLKEPDGHMFSEMSIEIENLTEWDYRPDVVFEIERDESLPRNSRWRIAVDPVEQRSVSIDDLTVALKRWYRLPSHDVRCGGLEASTFAVSYFTLTATKPRSVDEWVRTAEVFQDLITVAMDAPCAVLKETLKPTDELKANEESGARDEVVIYANHVVKGDPDASGVQGGDALFTLGVEGIDYETLIPRWFEVREQFHVACDMILSLIYVSDGYIQPQLVTAVAAAEAFHEALKLDPPMPNSEFNSLKKRLLERIPEDRRQWLREKLGRNNHTLRQRLIDLAALPDQEVMKLLLPNAKSWADAAKNSRNLVAHGGEGGSDVILMHAITEVTTAVIIVNVLHRLGVPAKIEAVTTTSRLERAARLAREKWPAASV
jgi:hypothetical protein